jgi:hypothetical protein
VGFPGRPRRFHPPHRATVSLLDFSQFRQFHLSRVPCSCTSDPIKKNSYVPSFHSWTLEINTQHQQQITSALQFTPDPRFSSYTKHSIRPVKQLQYLVFIFSWHIYV